MSSESLCQVIETDTAKCLNCQACIAACPVKFCNNASDGKAVTINADLCIGCGECALNCPHTARRVVDDTADFIKAAASGEKLVTIVAPAVAAEFPEQYLQLNGWLKSIGVAANFDVSFGAELTVKSYLAHIEENAPQTVIAQPCPALVAYLEIYQPQLLKHLAPADSPMLHTAKMIKQFYTDYKDHKIAVISPCIAKKREFVATGYGDYNVTMAQLQKYLQAQQVKLADFPKTAYDNPEAERAVLFSTPGGLMRTAMRWNPDILSITRKIEGPHTVYEYFDHLSDSLAQDVAPPLIDCLNCEKGCNGGTGTSNQGAPVDILESHIEKRSNAQREHYCKDGGEFLAKASIETLLDKYWQPGLYTRTYTDRSASNKIKEPDNEQLTEIYKKLRKETEADYLDCGACGYKSCRQMAIAIANGLNRRENCAETRLRLLDIASATLGDDLDALGQANMDDMFLTFHLGDEDYGIEIEYVTEIVGVEAITSVPDLPPYVKGIVNLRGKVISVVDMRLRFEMPEREYDERTCIIVVDINGTALGLVVDTVSEVLTINQEHISSPPKVAATASAYYIKGLGKIGEAVKILLDADKLIDTEEINATTEPVPPQP